MRHPVPEDLEWLDDAVDQWACTMRWDVRGHTPSVPSFVRRLWDGVATQRVTLDDDEQPSGLLQLVELNLVNRTARLEAITRDPTGVAPSTSAFVRQAASDFPLRIAYVYAVEDVLDTTDLLPAATEVGRLREHHLRGRGRYEDVVIHEVRLVAREVRHDPV